MKRISIILIAFGFCVGLLAIGYGETPKGSPPKMGKVLVKSLPKGTEGVELVAGGVRLKSGYKFVKQSNGSMMIGRAGGGGGGGLGLGGTWSCMCSKKGECQTRSSGSYLICEPTTGSDACTGTCSLTVVTTGARTAVIAY